MAKKGGICGAIGCLTLVALVGGFGWSIYTMVFTNTVAKWMGEETYKLKGDVTHFDPINGVAEVQEKVGPNATLVELRIMGARADGTLDLNATYVPGPRVDYQFERKLDKAPQGKTDPPIGAGRTPSSVWVEQVRVSVSRPGQQRHVSRRSGNSSSSYNYTMEGMDIDRDSRLADPSVALTLKPTVKEMWAIAQKAGAPSNAVAQITYRGSDADFNIPGVLMLQWEDGKLDEFFLKDEVKDKLGIKH